MKFKLLPFMIIGVVLIWLKAFQMLIPELEEGTGTEHPGSLQNKEVKRQPNDTLDLNYPSPFEEKKRSEFTKSTKIKSETKKESSKAKPDSLGNQVFLYNHNTRISSRLRTVGKEIKIGCPVKEGVKPGKSFVKELSSSQ